MRNMNEFVRRSGDDARAATGQTPPQPLSTKDIQMVAEVVHDPTLRRLRGQEGRHHPAAVRASIEFDVPEASRASLGGIQAGSIEFKVEFANVNGDQQIEAPAHARPLSSLTRSLGGSGALGGRDGHRGRHGAGHGNGDGTGSAPSVPDNANPGSQQFKDYADCLDKARPEDTEALQRCADLSAAPASVDSPAARPARPSPVVHRPAVGALVALVVGRGALQQHRAAVVADRRGSRRPPRRSGAGSAGTAASSSRLRSIGLASGPGSWISVGATHSTAWWARFHTQASWSGVSPWRSAIGRMRSSRSRPASTQPSGRKPRWSSGVEARGRGGRRRGRGRRSRPRG